MSNNEWITDRKPKASDAHKGVVWASRNDYTDSVPWRTVNKGEPWMPIAKPEPYVKTKRVRVVEERRYNDDGWEYAVTFGIGTVARHIPSREAAEEIAAIYERMMP